MNISPRTVSARTILDVVGRKPVLLVLGLVFTLIPIFIASLFLIIFSLLDNDVPKVDYELVDRDGTTGNALITDIHIQQNVTINNAHPVVISYRYRDHEKDIQSKYQTLDEYQATHVRTGDTIVIKYIGADSIIPAFEPVNFPFRILTTTVVIFLSAGLLLLAILFFYVRKHINLYRHGAIKEAKIISIGSSGPRLRGGVKVHYQYTTSRGQSILGTSITNDLTLLGKKEDDALKIFVSPVDESESCLIQKLDIVRNNWKID